ncbi:MAG: hypothetical protein ACOY46_02905 [Bacillota bacterium]
MQLKLISPYQKAPPTLPLVIKVGENIFETDCLPGLVAAVVGKEYMDVRTADAAWSIRVDSARQIAAILGAQGIPAIVRDHTCLLANNRLCPPDEVGEIGEIQWQKKEPLVIWAHPERAFIISLLEAGVIQVGEHPDSYIIRYGPPWEDLTAQNCGLCQYLKEGKCSVYESKCTLESGTQCPAFSPFKTLKTAAAIKSRYIGIDNTVPVARAEWQLKGIKRLDGLVDCSRWWD